MLIYIFMSETSFYNILVLVWLGLAAVVFLTLLFVPAPYGRFARGGFGWELRPQIGWFLMELPAVVVFGALFVLGERRSFGLVTLVLFGLWMTHYLHRAFFYPLRLRGNRRQMAFVTIFLGIVFNTGNAYLNARYLFTLGPAFPDHWLTDPRFLAGVTLFATGFALNKYSDETLIQLRAPGEETYRIPYGGPFRWVSCPNYLGEIMEWGGWALASWNPGGLAFFVWTAANLVPRALTTHRWYKRRFPDYPSERKALLPYLI